MSRLNVKILVVDDEVNIREALGALLEDDGYKVTTAASVEEAVKALQENDFHLVISDLRMNGQSGMEILRCMNDTCPETEMIFLTAYGTVEGAVEAMKLGAYDYIAKPVDRRRLTLLIEKALDKHRLSMENRNLRRRLSIKEEFSKIIGNSPAIRGIFKIMTEVAPTNATVLITGESGTGKELVAKSIHDRSQRRDRAFVALNCGALPETLIESELFGYEAGAFSGANTGKVGRIEMASGGTLFLDEVGDMSLKTQVDLLRVLQDRELRRLGSNRTINVDVRFIAATNKDLEEEITGKRFREDLYYRLNVVPIAMPPLRERREDIPLFLESFMTEFCQVHGKRIKTISENARKLLIQYEWPGNIRELRNTIERLVLLTRGNTIESKDLPDQIADAEDRQAEITLRLDQSLEDIEKKVIRSVLSQITQNRTLAARILGISLRALHYKIKRYRLGLE